jgi:hypothetical protein
VTGRPTLTVLGAALLGSQAGHLLVWAGIDHAPRFNSN